MATELPPEAEGAEIIRASFGKPELHTPPPQAGSAGPVAGAAGTPAASPGASAPPMRPGAPADAFEGGGDPNVQRLGDLPPDCPVIPLGYAGEARFYLDAVGQFASLLVKDHGRLNLMGMFGAHQTALQSWWPRKNKDGDIVGWKPEETQAALIAACARCGAFDPAGRVRGRGAWRGEDGELIWHCGDHLLIRGAGAAGAHEKPVLQPTGLYGRHIYPTQPEIPRPADDPQPAGELGPGGRLLAVLRTWRFVRAEEDPMLLLGWIAAAMVGGALPWRPLMWLTGDIQTGKSTLQGLLKGVLTAILSSSDASAAGIWQTLKFDSLPVAIDELEAEADNRKQHAVIRLAREAAGGGGKLRGSAGHGAVEFQIVTCFLFSSVLPPPMTWADSSRMAMLELRDLAGGSPPKVTAAQYAELGRQLRRRLLDQWPRLDATLEAYRGTLMVHGHSNRSADVFGTLLACADLLLYDHAPDGDMLQMWGERLTADRLSELADESANWRLCINHLLTTKSRAYQGSIDLIGTLIAKAAGFDAARDLWGDPDDAAARELASYGLKVLDGEDRRAQWLAVTVRHEELAKLFQYSPWRSEPGMVGGWVTSLLRVPQSERRKVRIGATSLNCVLVPIEAVLGGQNEES